MKPYYLNLNKRLISDSFSTKLVEIAESNINSFESYVSKVYNEPDGIEYLNNNKIAYYPEIAKLKKICRLDFSPVLIMQKPNTVIRPHVDDGNKRSSLLITPLMPRINYVPTLFWDRNTKTHVATCEFPNFNTALINTKELHGLTNINVHRINLQFCFNESFETVANLYETGELFKN